MHSEEPASPVALWPQSSSSQGSLLSQSKRKRGSAEHPRQQIQPVKRQTEQLSCIKLPVDMENASLPPESAPSGCGPDRMVAPATACDDRTDRMDWQHAYGGNRGDQSPFSHYVRATPNPPPMQPSTTRENPPKAAGPSSDALRDTIEANFSLEVLLKHRELRLIDQEIAKCQVAFEQLRRCQTIPYPSMSSGWEALREVATGTGPTQERNAPAAPPWGVTTGPYSRHYRQWLLPDPAFGDRLTAETLTVPSTTYSERSVRASTAGKSSQAAQSRAQRGAGSARLQALPHSYPEAKEDKGPMIVKRSSDGQRVKLVCLDCRRSDFNSVQGFINHCRIAHSRNFQSHDAAAVACGEEVEFDQTGGIVGEAYAAASTGAGLVHPLIRSAHVASSAAPTPPMKLPQRGPSEVSRETSCSKSLQDTTTFLRDAGTCSPDCASSPFRPSLQTPHLSAFFAKVGRGDDLEAEVNIARSKVDVNAAMSSDEETVDDIEEEPSQPVTGPVSHSTRGVVRPDHPPSRAVMAPAQLDRSPCVKPPKARSRKPMDLANLDPSPVAPSSVRLRGTIVNHNQPSQDHETSGRDSVSPTHLSPNTVESHQAPSLVSDDDEFENTHSECSSSAGIAEDLEHHYFGLGFENHNEAAMEDLEAAGSSASGKHLALGAGPKAHLSQPASAMRSPDAVRDPTVHDSRHVSFASPLRRPRKKRSK